MFPIKISSCRCNFAVLIWLLSFKVFCYASEIDIVSKDEPPYIFAANENSHQAKGPIVDVINAVCSEMSINCAVTIFPWPRAQAMVRLGSVQAIALVRRTDDRATWLDFSPPIVDSEYGFFVKEENQLNYLSPKDITNYKVAVYGPSATEDELHELSKQNPNFKEEITPDIESGFRKLTVNRVDAVFSNKAIGEAYIARMHLTGLRYAGVEKRFQYFIGFSKKITDAEFVHCFKTAYLSLYFKGKIGSILAAQGLTPAILRKNYQYVENLEAAKFK